MRRPSVDLEEKHEPRAATLMPSSFETALTQAAIEKRTFRRTEKGGEPP
jgi:hypothetical protein